MKVFVKINDVVYQDDKFNDFATTVLYYALLKWKYKTMWDLRSLENEIQEENGIIIIEQNGEIHFNGFSEELTERMFELLKD